MNSSVSAWVVSALLFWCSDVMDSISSADAPNIMLMMLFYFQLSAFILCLLVTWFFWNAPVSAFIVKAVKVVCYDFECLEKE